MTNEETAEIIEKWMNRPSKKEGLPKLSKGGVERVDCEFVLGLIEEALQAKDEQAQKLLRVSLTIVIPAPYEIEGVEISDQEKAHNNGFNSCLNILNDKLKALSDRHLTN